ncbi:MAG: GspE/PulE family protein [Deltaproteobacteria bacterium]|nr:GspE/PulE family protein [Deltaproteobacteria bacterium]
MKKRTGNPFAPEKICAILREHNLISPLQEKMILAKRREVEKKIELINCGKKANAFADARFLGDISIIDVIAFLNLTRADQAEKVLNEELIYQVLADEWKIPYKKIDPLKLDLKLVTTTIPLTFAMKHLILPIGIEDQQLLVATANPFLEEALEDVARASHMPVKPVLTSKGDIIRLIKEFFGFKRSISAAETQFTQPGVDIGNLEQYVRLDDESDDLGANVRHIVNAVDHILSYAFDQRASDVHIEPKRETSVVRMRIDGVLHTAYKLPKPVHAAIVSRIKNLARLDMSEKRRPQDGRIKTDKAGVEVEIRVSTIPVAFGEKLVMRIMDPDVLFQDLKYLGFSAGDMALYQKFIERPHGIVLVCGPTGSGKSTTLYSTLRLLSTPEVNVTTIEDPIEMIHEEFNQIGVQPAVGVTFSSILRNILRQDPDIIMIGEMRDLETAQNAVQAALTGHLVLSTLHTNDAPSAVTRLLDLGIPPFLIESTLIGVLAQRLVRKICLHCRESFTMSQKELAQVGLDPGKEGQYRIYRGKGCIRCRGTGYMGRIGVFEVLPLTERIRTLIRDQGRQVSIRAEAISQGMIPLRQNALKAILKGTTTYQEALRVTWEQ